MSQNPADPQEPLLPRRPQLRRLRPQRLVAPLACTALLVGCSAAGADHPAAAARGPSSTTAGSAAATDPTSRTASPTAPSGTSPGTSPATAATVTVAFGGDVHFEGADGARLAANPRTAIGPVSALLRRADVAMVNLETAVTTRGTPQAKEFVFRAPPTAFTALRSAGVDVVTQANNHGMDYGLVGLHDSIAAAHSARFPVVGNGMDADAAFAPWTTTVRGTRISVIGATQVLDANLSAAWTAGVGKPGLASAKDVPRLLAAVRAARAHADVVVVYVHWGTEMHSCPTTAQTSLARAVTNAGADVLVGSHAHVLLGAGRMGSSYVDYGLGNFVFYAHSGPTVSSGVLTLTLKGRRVQSARWSPARISDGIPVPLRGSAADSARDSWVRLRSCTGLAAVPGS